MRDEKVRDLFLYVRLLLSAAVSRGNYLDFGEVIVAIGKYGGMDKQR